MRVVSGSRLLGSSVHKTKRVLKFFFKRLQGQAIRRGAEDVMVWWVSKGDIFMDKSFYSS